MRIRIMSIILMALALCLVPVLSASADAPERELAMPASGWDPLSQVKVDGSGVWSRLGQRLTTGDWTITTIGYRICREGNPTGNIVLSLYDSVTGELIAARTWGDAGDLPEANVGTSEYQKVTFDPPIRLVNRDIRLVVEYWGGNGTDYVRAGYFSGDRRSGEWYTNYFHYGQWHDIGEAEEGAYYLAYIDHTEPHDGNTEDGSRTSIPMVAIPVVFGLTVGLVVYAKKRKSNEDT